MKIVSLDPGGTTGYAHFDSETETWGVGEIKTDSGEHHHALWTFLHDELYKHPENERRVVCERFDNTGNEAALLISAEYIGVVKLFCIMNRTELFMSNRSNKDVTFLKGNELKRFQVWSGSKHARDAARHLIHYRIFELGEKPLLNVWRNGGAQ
jgi:hypothetical protein